MNDTLHYGEADGSVLLRNKINDQIETAALAITYQPSQQHILEWRSKFTQADWLTVLTTNVETAYARIQSGVFLSEYQHAENLYQAVRGTDTEVREKHFSKNTSLIQAAMQSRDHRVIEELFTGVSFEVKKRICGSKEFIDYAEQKGDGEHDTWIGNTINFLFHDLNDDQRYELIRQFSFTHTHSPTSRDDIDVDLLTYSINNNRLYTAGVIIENLSIHKRLALFKNERERSHIDSIRSACIQGNVEGLKLLKRNLSYEQWRFLAKLHDLEVIAKINNTELFRIYQNGISGDHWNSIISDMIGTTIVIEAAARDNAQIIELTHDNLTQEQWIKILETRNYHDIKTSCVYSALHGKNHFSIDTINAIKKGVSSQDWLKLLAPRKTSGEKTVLTDINIRADNLSDAIEAIRNPLSTEQWVALLSQHSFGITLIYRIAEQRVKTTEAESVELNNAIDSILKDISEEQLTNLLSIQSYKDWSTPMHFGYAYNSILLKRITPDSLLKIASLESHEAALIDQTIKNNDSKTRDAILFALHDKPAELIKRVIQKSKQPYAVLFEELCTVFEIQKMDRTVYEKVIHLLPKLLIVKQALLLSDNEVIRLISNSESGLHIPDNELLNQFLSDIEQYTDNELHDTRDSIKKFSNQFLLPLVLLKANITEISAVALEDLKTKVYMQAIRYLLFTNSNQSIHLGLPLTLRQLVKMSRQLHRAHEGIPNALLENIIEWKSLFKDTNKIVYEIDKQKYEIVALTSLKDLQGESEEMNHCVGRGSNYAMSCAAGKSHILSVRRKIDDDRYDTLSTLEVAAKERNIDIIQHRGHSNHNPSENAVEVMRKLMRDISSAAVELSNEYGETDESKAKSQQRVIINTVGFEPTPEKLREVFMYYADMTWDEGKNQSGRKIRSIFCPIGESNPIQNTYIRHLYLDQHKSIPLSAQPLIDTHANMLDETFDHIAMRISKESQIFSTQRLLAL